jgi:sialidase-1
MDNPVFSRRQCIKAIAATTLAGVPGARFFAAEPHQIKIEEIRVISWKSPLYHGWPNLARRTNGELLLAFSGGREAHVCPFGRLELMRLKDN